MPSRGGPLSPELGDRVGLRAKPCCQAGNTPALSLATVERMSRARTSRNAKNRPLSGLPVAARSVADVGDERLPRRLRAGLGWEDRAEHTPDATAGSKFDSASP
jgi:hypothetical protein